VDCDAAIGGRADEDPMLGLVRVPGACGLAHGWWSQLLGMVNVIPYDGAEQDHRHDAADDRAQLPHAVPPHSVICR